MSPRRGSTPLVLLAVLALGCGPVVDVGEHDPSSSGGAETSTGTPAGTSTSGGDDTTSMSTSTGEPPSDYEDDGVDTGCAFTCPDLPPPLPPPGAGWCDLTCPDGEKCAPWSNDSSWDTVRCVPLAPDAHAPGEPCVREGGIDDCDATSVCWQVDSTTHVGTCHPFCSTTDEPVCPPGLTCGVVPENVPLCLTTCDPLVPTCDVNLQCLPYGTGFTCFYVYVGGTVPQGEPCDGPYACEPDSLCAFDPAFSCGNAPGQGCCAAPCDVNDPGPCDGPGSTCVPWFPFRAPPELAHLGACAVP